MGHGIASKLATLPDRQVSPAREPVIVKTNLFRDLHLFVSQAMGSYISQLFAAREKRHALTIRQLPLTDQDGKHQPIIQRKRKCPARRVWWYWHHRGLKLAAWGPSLRDLRHKVKFHCGDRKWLQHQIDRSRRDRGVQTGKRQVLT